MEFVSVGTCWAFGFPTGTGENTLGEDKNGAEVALGEGSKGRF